MSWWRLLNCDVVCNVHVYYWLVLVPILARHLWCSNEARGMRMLGNLSFTFF
jgi:hypothetical protein